MRGRLARALHGGGVLPVAGLVAVALVSLAPLTPTVSASAPTSTDNGAISPLGQRQVGAVHCSCATSQLPGATGRGTHLKSWRDLPQPVSNAADSVVRNQILAANAAYTALSPTRLLDTRLTGQTLGPDDSLSLAVTGGSVPASATAVALNVTVTDTTAASFLSVYPTGEARPVLSNLNWVAGETIPNLVIVPVGSGGQITVFNHAGKADVVVDLEGYFSPEPSGTTAGSYVALTPARIVDTRPGSGQPYSGQTLSAGSALDIQVAGQGGVPATGVAAAVLNVTVTDVSSAGYLTVFPQANSRPVASNLNWVTGDTVANRVVVPVNPATGQVTLYNFAGTTDVVVDVDGYFTAGTSAPANAGLFTTINPVRLLDTRVSGQTLGPGHTLSLPVAGRDGIAGDATSVVTNVTAADTTASSYFTVYPGGSLPLASDLNWRAGQVVPNLTFATLSAGGSVSVYNHSGNADLIIDAFGFFGPRIPLEILTTAPPAASRGQAYSFALEAAGGLLPYSWTLTSGALPTGLTMTSGGVIQGTASTTGTFTFGVTVTDSTSPTAESASATMALTVVAAGLLVDTAPLPGGVVGQPYSSQLTASGGTAPYTWQVASGGLPAGLSLAGSGAIGGTPTNSGTFTFQVSVTDSSSPTPESGAAALSITIALGMPAEVQSSNWSGYAVGNGPYTSASGTFTVPSLYSGQTGSALSVWVGIDGLNNSHLIQAGITEIPDPNNSSAFLLIPWWEILPAPETPITTMTVSPNNLISVSLSQVSPGLWSIELTDDTTGQSFTIQQPYSGPMASAEWIAEAPEVNGAFTPLAPYTQTTFSNLGVAGPENQLTEIFMVQNGAVVSTPSALTAAGFNVAYGSAAPPPP